MRTMMLSKFERSVLGWIVEHTEDLALRDQLADAEVVERDYTVVGCYTSLVIPGEAAISTAEYANHGPLDGPEFESKVVEFGGTTLLWFKSGKADCLEMAVYGDYFPENHDELGSVKLNGRA